jgi:hypothetical protein
MCIAFILPSDVSMSNKGQERIELESDKYKANNAERAPKRRPTTPAEEQALKLERLLANPDKAVVIPARPSTEKTLRAPREMMKNVSGSSAGAGSGEFHIYKHSRRREGERVKLMEDAAQREKDAKDFAERQRILAEESSAKTDKNRTKRDKKKLAKAAAKEAEKLTKMTAAARQSEDYATKRPAELNAVSDTSKRRRQNGSVVITDGDDV